MVGSPPSHRRTWDPNLIEDQNRKGFGGPCCPNPISYRRETWGLRRNRVVLWLPSELGSVWEGVSELDPSPLLFALSSNPSIYPSTYPSNFKKAMPFSIQPTLLSSYQTPGTMSGTENTKKTHTSLIKSSPSQEVDRNRNSSDQMRAIVVLAALEA